ncbi:MAG TPA: toll/interleukin-1 receptor domain-containing protein [Pyrinomonadaceae bacterium]|nr:toll/interleukin-1 receptor domain-containing protein [Pyrinomonadaceae bacterium]
MSRNAQDARPLLFISHKHENSRVADVLRNFIEMNTAGVVDVYQSSSEQAAGPRAGFSLNQELKDALWRAGAFVLIYTHSSLDWSYCMFEYGVANNPKTPDTRIILLRCCDAVPALFAGQVTRNARELQDVQKFVNELLTDPEFFAGYGRAVTRHQPNSGPVATAAARLFQELQEVLPAVTPPANEEWPAYPYIQLQLDWRHVETIRNAPPAERAQIASQVIQNEAVVSAYDKEAERLFNSPGFERGIKFEALVSAWKDKEPGPDVSSKWVSSLCRQITEGARWRFPPSVWELMQGINDDTWRAPVLTRVRRMPNQHMQFDVYFYKFDVDEGSGRVKVNLPEGG